MTLFSTAQSWAFFDPYQVYRPQRFDLAVDTQFYKTTANFDSGGEKVDLPFENSFQIIDVNPQLRWAMFRDFGVRIGGNVGSAESVDPINTRNNSTFNRIDVGADYQLLNYETFQTIVDFEYSLPVEKFDTATDSSLSGNGATEIKPTLLMRMDLGSFYPYAYVGGNFRSEGLSTLLTYGLGGEFRFSELGLGAVVEGFSSVKDDQYTNSATRRDAITTRVNGGSKKFYSINPNSLAAEVFLNFAMTEWIKFKAYGGTDVTGSNTSQGFFVGAALNFTLDYGNGNNQDSIEEQREVRRSQRAKKVKTKSSNNGFQESTEDGVDQNYFKSVDPNNGDYVQPVEQQQQQQPAPSAGRPQNGTSSSVTGSDSGTQSDLDQLGYQIKLKKLKKKKKKNQ
ncbi:hypothetical protein CIK05_02415 [Bdellovibrio sp. qaytius]|nr:hypothetical protein CIK05_02415 [Bdellovibrio sp. qaytius]